MKSFFEIFITLIIFNVFLFAQDYPESHIPAAHDHSTSICHGYAMGRAFGKTTGDAFCDPAHTWNNQIDPNYFTLTNDPALYGIKSGDIVSWGSNHSAYVIFVPSPLYDIGYIRVDQVPHIGGPEQKNLLLESVMAEFGNPIGYYEGNRGIKIRFTFRNSFESGILEVKQSTKPIWYSINHGESKLYSQNSTLDIKAIDGQEYAGYLRRYQNWKKDRDYLGSQNPISETVDASRTYSAVFSKEFNVEFRNDFEGSGGGQIKVEGIIEDAPYVAKVLEQDPSVTAEAINGQNINGVIYNFDHWDNGITSNPHTFTVNDHDEITAIFKEALSVDLSGPTFLYYNETGTFTANPSGGSGTYNNYRWWRRDDDEPIRGNKTRRPPPGVWNEVTSWEGQQTVSTYGPISFSLKCEVTDSDNNTATDIHSVHVVGGFVAKAAGNSSDLEIIAQIPDEILLSSNYPNPFNPSTTIKFGLPNDTYVELNIYSVTSEKIKSLANGVYSAGYHSVRWDGTNDNNIKVTAGIYIYELQANGIKFHKKMILAK